MYGVYVCWLAREDEALDSNEDDMVSSYIPELDSEHELEEQDDSNVDVLGWL